MIIMRSLSESDQIHDAWESLELLHAHTRQRVRFSLLCFQAHYVAFYFCVLRKICPSASSETGWNNSLHLQSYAPRETYRGFDGCYITLNFKSVETASGFACFEVPYCYSPGHGGRGA
jgi:hypothetical protein